VQNYPVKNLEQAIPGMYIRFTTVAGNFGNRKNCDRTCGNPSKDGSKFRKHQVSKYKGASLSTNKLGAFVFTKPED
jgi:hypothetical protein